MSGKIEQNSIKKNEEGPVYVCVLFWFTCYINSKKFYYIYIFNKKNFKNKITVYMYTLRQAVFN